MKKKKRIKKLIKKLNIEPSGFYNYDEEFIKINKKIYVRMTIIGAHTRLIINDQIIKREKFKKKLLKNTLKNHLKD